MHKGSPFVRFARISRNFGVRVAARVAYSKLRGLLFPALALAKAANYDAPRRKVSFLLNARDSVDCLDRLAAACAGRGQSDWEVCIHEETPADPLTARMLARHRGAHPWLRVVTADGPASETIGIRWTVEQATGQFIALAAPGFAPEADNVAQLVARLGQEPGIDAAAAPDGGLLLVKKSSYLSVCEGRWSLSPAAVARYLAQSGAIVADMSTEPSDAAG